MYIVIKDFSDLQDKNIVYYVNDFYPKLGKKVTEERLDELSGSNNKRGEPLITKTELSELNINQLCQYASFKNVDLKAVILSKIEGDIYECEIATYQKKAKKYKLEFTEETTLEDLKNSVETYEKEHK